MERKMMRREKKEGRRKKERQEVYLHVSVRDFDFKEHGSS